MEIHLRRCYPLLRVPSVLVTFTVNSHCWHYVEAIFDPWQNDDWTIEQEFIHVNKLLQRLHAKEINHERSERLSQMQQIVWLAFCNAHHTARCFLHFYAYHTHHIFLHVVIFYHIASYIFSPLYFFNWKFGCKRILQQWSRLRLQQNWPNFWDETYRRKRMAYFIGSAPLTKMLQLKAWPNNWKTYACWYHFGTAV